MLRGGSVRSVSQEEALRLQARTLPQSPLGSFSRRGGDDEGAAPPQASCGYATGRLNRWEEHGGHPLLLPRLAMRQATGRALRL